ncbi:sensor histidine kinase [Specibacter sp. AOP5-B1-6]|uniref:sensor histidine kinase n=1 Tax=Specibacter sp. AOP5-B1-6 TaxID=3457653 RepID=UPI00402BCF2C
MRKLRPRRWMRALRYLVIESVAAAASLCFVVAGLVLLPLGLITGLPFAPAAVALLRRWADLARKRTSSFSGRQLVISYPPITAGSYKERILLLRSRATRKDALWLLAHGIALLSLGFAAIGLPLAAVNSLLIPLYWEPLSKYATVANPYPVVSWQDAATMPVVAAVYALLSWWLVPAAARLFSWSQTKLLNIGRATLLAARVTALTASRAAALEAHSSELRRIERDLHDGAQNKLVSVVMMLGMAMRSVETGGSNTSEHLRRAQDAATDALSNLRTMVHDIYPPILDELGLEGALAAVAVRSGCPCTLHVSHLPRSPAAVEAAAYFVVAEAVTNANKHGSATRLDLSATFEVVGLVDCLVLTVQDDGVGGAVERPAGGLAGIRRRVEAFEGTMAVSSPVGGPTMIRTVLPCAW